MIHFTPNRLWSPWHVSCWVMMRLPGCLSPVGFPASEPLGGVPVSQLQSHLLGPKCWSCHLRTLLNDDFKNTLKVLIFTLIRIFQTNDNENIISLQSLLTTSQHPASHLNSPETSTNMNHSRLFLKIHVGTEIQTQTDMCIYIYKHIYTQSLKIHSIITKTLWFHTDTFLGFAPQCFWDSI